VGTNELPAFYTRTSGLPLEHRVDDAAKAARVLVAHWSLAAERGVLLANPIPEADGLDPQVIGRAVDAALEDAARRSIRGKALTPHLLAFLAQATQKRSLAANRALALNNAAFGAQVAVELARLLPRP
jgi:pseudouridine-5'-phosphate glycosidase